MDKMMEKYFNVKKPASISGTGTSSTSSTKVISVKKKDLLKFGYSDFDSWAKSPNNVYIGRQVSYPNVYAPQSKWANPFTVEKYGRGECIRLYEEHVRNSNLFDQLEELEGKVLGCWCKPEPCHGDILVRLLKEKKEKALAEKTNLLN